MLPGPGGERLQTSQRGSEACRRPFPLNHSRARVWSWGVGWSPFEPSTATSHKCLPLRDRLVLIWIYGIYAAGSVQKALPEEKKVVVALPIQEEAGEGFAAHAIVLKKRGDCFNPAWG
jgi:hypothetical protein